MHQLPDILVYHTICDDREFPSSARTNVRPSDFREQLDYVRARYNTVSLDRALSDEVRPAKREIAITFDDGYRDNRLLVYPLLHELRVPITFFLSVSRIDKDWDFSGSSYPGLTWREIREMEEDPLVCIGSHGFSHRDLTGLPEEESAAEIQSSRIILEENLTGSIRYLSYPHGSYNPTIAGQVKDAGYLGAFSVISENADKFSLRRILISRKDNMFRFRLKLSPIYWPLRKIL